MKACELRPGHVIRVGPYGEKFTVREVRSTHKDGVAIRIRGRSPLYVRWDDDFWVESVDEPLTAPGPGPMCRCAISPDITQRDVKPGNDHDPGDEQPASLHQWKTVRDERVRPEHIELRGDIVDESRQPARSFAESQRAALRYFNSPAYAAAIEQVRRDIIARIDRERMGGAIAFITPKRAREAARDPFTFGALFALPLIADRQAEAGILANHDSGDEDAATGAEREEARRRANPFKFSKRRLF